MAVCALREGWGGGGGWVLIGSIGYECLYPGCGGPDIIVNKSTKRDTLFVTRTRNPLRCPLYLGYDMYPSISVQDAILAELPGLMKKFVSEPWRFRFPMVCFQVFTLYIHCTVYIYLTKLYSTRIRGQSFISVWGGMTKRDIWIAASGISKFLYCT